MEVIVLLVLIAICVGFYFKFRKGQSVENAPFTIDEKRSQYDTEAIRKVLESTKFTEIKDTIFRCSVEVQDDQYRNAFIVVKPDEVPILMTPIALNHELDEWDIIYSNSFDQRWRVVQIDTNVCIDRKLEEVETKSSDALVQATLDFVASSLKVEEEARGLRKERLPLLQEITGQFTSDRWDEITTGSVSLGEILPKLERLLVVMPNEQLWSDLLTAAVSAELQNFGQDRFEKMSQDPWHTIVDWMQEFGEARSWQIRD